MAGKRPKGPRDLEDVTRTWMGRLLRAKAHAAPHLAKYERNLAAFMSLSRFFFNEQGELDADIPESGYFTEINRLLGTIASQRSGISYLNPWIKTRPRRPLPPELAENAKASEYVLNYVLRHPEAEMDEELRLFLTAMFLAYGAFEVNFTPDDGKDRPAREGQLEKTSEGGFEVVGGVPAYDETRNRLLQGAGGGLLLEEEYVPCRNFTLEWCDWRNLLHDPEGGSRFRDHAFIARRSIVRLDDFMAEDKWRHAEDIERAAKRVDALLDLGRASLEKAMNLMLAIGGGTPQPLSLLGEAGYSTDEDDDLRLVMWTIYDLRERKIETLIEDHPQLVSPEENDIPGWCGFAPFTFGRIHVVPNEWYPMTEVEAYLPTAKNYNERVSLKLTHMRRSLRKYETAAGHIDDDNKEMLKNPIDGVVVETETGHDVNPIPDAPFDPSVYADMNQDKIDGAEIMGSSPEAEASGGESTATEVMAIARRGTRREGEKRKIFAAAYVHACGKLLQALQAHLPAALAIRIVGPSGQFWEGRAARADIAGDFETYLELKDLGPPDGGLKLSKLMQLSTVFGPLIWRVRLWVERVLREAEEDDPELVSAIVAEYEKAQTEALIEQQIRQGGLRGVGAQEPAGGPGTGGGQGGSRIAARAMRTRP